jgi:3,5-epimerase/4-reductase
MKVLIYGGNGWIGSQIVNLLLNLGHQVIKGEIRAENIDELELEIKNVNPTHIMSFIGRTHGKIDDTVFTTIDYLEQSGKLKENVRDNLYSPLVLAILSTKFNIHYTYIGTGCIFDYDTEHPYAVEQSGFTENDTPNFFGSSYSVVKGYTDRLMHLFEDKVLNIRIRMPITGDLNVRNFITKIITYKKVCSIPNSMTVLPEILPLIIDMADKKITGTINATNPNIITHNEILEMYKEIVDNNFKWENFSIEEQDKILSSKRSNNCLNTKKIESLYPEILDIKKAVRKCLENIAKNKNV